jgi:hypothetical protein
MKNIKFGIAALMLLVISSLSMQAQDFSWSLEDNPANIDNGSALQTIKAENGISLITCGIQLYTTNSNRALYLNNNNSSDPLRLTSTGNDLVSIASENEIEKIEVEWGGNSSGALPYGLVAEVPAEGTPTLAHSLITWGSYPRSASGWSTYEIDCTGGNYKYICFGRGANGTSGNTWGFKSIKVWLKVLCTPATASFAAEEVTKTLGDDPFTNVFTSEENTSEKVFASSNTDVATVDAATGEVTILAVGATTITVAQAADEPYCAVEKSYTLTVEEPVANFVITPSSNNTTLGTVSIEGAVITAVPGNCSDYADPAYTVLNGTVKTISQSGNAFTVVATSDCAIQINFVAKPLYTVTLNPGSGSLTGDAQLTQADCVTGVTLPAAATCSNDYAFAGWATAEVAETTTSPTLIPAGDYLPAENITLYAVYSYTDGEENIIRTWDFEGEWSINAETVDANLTLDGSNRFDYVPRTESAPLVFANGDPIADVADLLFTQTGGNKVRLGFAPTRRVYLNGASIAMGIPCSPGNTVTVIGEPGSSSATDRGFAATGGALIADKCVNVSENGIMTTSGAGVRGTWVYNATGNSLVISTVKGGCNVFKIIVSNSATTTYNSNPECSECTPPAKGTFAEEAVEKNIDDPAFINAFTPGDNTSPVVYESTNTEVATVDAATGEVTIVAPGETTIKATQVEDDTYCETETSYVLTVAAPVYRIIALSSDDTYGTVVLDENKITALPVKGYQLAETAYQVVPEGAATITKNGNVFTVTATANVTVQINFEALPSPLTWNFSDTGFESKTYGEATVVDGLTIGPNTTLEVNEKKLDGFNFTHRFKFNGTGSTSNRYVSFPVTGNTAITIYGMSASNNNERTLNVADEAGTVIGTFVNGAVDGALGKTTVEYTGPATTIYIYSANSGFNIYAINCAEIISTSYTITALSSDDTHGTVALEENVITATPAAGYRVSIETPYTIEPEGSATVTQDGNVFTVTELTANTTVTIHFEFVTGIKAVPATGLTVQRNAQSLSITSDASDPIKQVEIYNLQGRLIYSQQVNAVTHTLRENINSGLYIAKVRTQKATQIIKALK